MITFESHYFGINRYFLLALGLWPYHNSIFDRLKLILLLSILLTSIIAQLAILFTQSCTIKILIKVFSTVMMFISYAMKYILFCIKGSAVIHLNESVQHLCNELKDANEIAIIEKYRISGRRYTIGLTIFATIWAFGISFSPILLRISDYILSLNQTRSYYFIQIMTEYFIDQEKYSYLILLHTIATIFIGTFTLLATGTMLVVYIQYACGMFSIVSYRIENTMNINILRNINLNNEHLIYEGVVCAIDMHQKAIKLADLIMSEFKLTYLFIIGALVLSLSLNLFQIFQAWKSKNFLEEFPTPVMCIIMHYVYLFVANFVCQNVTDHSNYLFTTTYSVPWYIAPLHVQKMILFLLQKTTKNYELRISGGLFAGSLEGMVKLTSAAMSYFTVLMQMSI